MCIVIIFYPGCEGTNFETDFLSSRFPTWPKKLGQKLKYVKNENPLSIKQKAFFHKSFFSKSTFIEDNKTNFFGSWETDFKACRW